MTAHPRLSFSEPFLPYGRQTIEQDDIEAVLAVLRSDYLTTGPASKLFEETFASYVSTEHAVVCSSGTAALHLAALALDLGPGDSVIVPTLTFLATANAIRFVGAEVVFADVDPQTGLMSSENLLDAIENCSGKPRAVFPVHLNGQCVEMEKLTAVARDHEMYIVEDACHALGTKYLSSKGGESRVGSCTYSDLTVFSFHPVKTIAMGEGGALTTNREDLALRLRQLRNHGMSRNPENFINKSLGFSPDGTPNPWYYEMQELGHNYRASDIHCALGLSQLNKLEGYISRRQSVSASYNQQLTNKTVCLTPLTCVPWNDPAWHLYVVHIEFKNIPISRAQLMHTLRNAGIGTQVHYLPVHLQPYYHQRYGAKQLPGAEAYYQSCLSLPLYPTMKQEDVKRVTEILLTTLETTS